MDRQAAPDGAGTVEACPEDSRRRRLLLKSFKISLLVSLSVGTLEVLSQIEESKYFL